MRVKRVAPNRSRNDRQARVFILVAAALLILCVSSAISNTFSYINPTSVANTGGVAISSPVYVWFFGYVGNAFYPSAQLSISESKMLSTAQSLSSTFGKQNLVLMTTVDEIPLANGNINESMVSTIASYISELKQYAGAVYGRLDFYEFNLTASSYGDCSSWSTCPIYNQSALYIDQLGLNGIWFDHASQYYEEGCLKGSSTICGVGPAEFNFMMQNLTNLFPGATFILNQTPGGTLPYVQVTSGDCGGECTWGNQTYVSPSPPQDSLALKQSGLQIENSLFPGHVIAHLDAEGPPAIGSNPQEPMSIFADENATQEVSAMQALYYNSTHPALPNETYSMVMPLIGSWTCDCVAYGTSGSNYSGTLYNALSSGVDSRSMISSLKNVIKNNLPPSYTIGLTSGTVGQEVSLTGKHFIPSYQVAIKFDGIILSSAKSNSKGKFSTAFTVPNAYAGTHLVQVTYGPGFLSSPFSVTPNIAVNPDSGRPFTTVMINGTGFGSSLDITLYFNGQPVRTNPNTITSNSSGNFNATFQVPYTRSQGNYVVEATDSSGNSASTTFST